MCPNTFPRQWIIAAKQQYRNWKFEKWQNIVEENHEVKWTGKTIMKSPQSKWQTQFCKNVNINSEQVLFIKHGFMTCTVKLLASWTKFIYLHYSIKRHSATCSYLFPLKSQNMHSSLWCDRWQQPTKKFLMVLETISTCFKTYWWTIAVTLMQK